jgi:hypothetical protein
MRFKSGGEGDSQPLASKNSENEREIVIPLMLRRVSSFDVNLSFQTGSNNIRP